MLGSVVSVAADTPKPQPHDTIFPLATRWSIDVGGPPVVGASPIADEHGVYVALRSGHIASYDLDAGRERWRKPVTAAHPLAADGGLLFVATDETIEVHRSDDGALVWETTGTTTAPLLARAGWLIALADGKVRAFRATDGTRIWEHDVGPATERPAIEGDQLYVPVTDGRVIALNVTNGDVLWERRLGGVPEAPFATGDRLYVGASDRYFYCLDASNGEIEYQWRIGTALQGSAAADSSFVFIVALDNVVRALDRGNGNQRWKHALARRPATGPFVIGSSVLVASASSAEIWAWSTKGGSEGTIVTPAEPAEAPEFLDRGNEGALVVVITGGLTAQWRLTLLATAGDPPLEPMKSLPGEVIELKR
jgi:outer membrane protein assembly factor BamB